MYIYIGIALVVISVAVLVFALLRSRKEPIAIDTLLDEDVAIQKAFEIIDILPESESFSSILLAQEPVEIRLAKIFDNLFSQNNISRAHKIAQIIVEYVPDNPAGYSRLGLALLRLGKYDRAENAFRNALEIDPTDSKSANNLGYILNRKEKYAEAVKILNPLLGDEEDNLVTIINLGIALYHTGNVARAFELMNAAYKKNPELPEIHLYIGHCLKSFGEMDKANIAYQRYRLLTNKPEVESASKENKDGQHLQETPNQEITSEHDVFVDDSDEEIEDIAREEVIAPDTTEDINISDN